MKKALVLLFLIAAFAATAQTPAAETKPFKRFTLGDINASIGYFGHQFNFTGDDIENMAGRPIALLQDSGTYVQKYFDETPFVTFSANFNINSKNKQLYQSIGAGIGYSNFWSFSYSNTDFYREALDTLQSDNADYYVIVDTIRQHNRIGQNQSRNLFVNLNYRISTNPARKFSVYATANLALGGSVTSNYTEFESYWYGKRLTPLLDSTGTDDNVTNINSYGSYGYGFQMPVTDSYKSAKSFTIRPYASVGLNYRLSKKIPVLRNISVNLEWRMGGNFMFVKGRSYGDVSRGMAFGLRYTVNALPNPKKQNAK
ncbi:MAG: hypothetical protein M0D57_02570 [Sphingobacteriales bacterium JAD_PAG50586_3]|nr:MAG: hypothetical protein M0D57_02570 [Sphingobacteriales bacterium JAD_PAG50586_3]